ncbi:hypothetical protein JZK55_06110 [Dissulfurispira thermophila]|uniref:Uncharacterized protein n=1 Tax=Dissulfurispira thermophila TaxID=2715679 RepID=A0A7G1H090_9BACT|nr:tetratricopeptide repeat protein [Dissulfurispira thermophila]BCB95689.1 hypothetical protein JZK55_06110 [Dissulfurispira thermophila]
MKRYIVVFIIILTGLILFSCKREQPKEERAVQRINPYTNESVFEEVKKKLQANPADADLWYHLADLYDRSGMYNEAIEAFKKVVELKPDMGYAYFKMGTAYNRIDKPEKAVKSFKKAIQLMPDYAVAHNNLAIAYGKLGNTSEEINALKKAIKLRPRYGVARYNLGIAYLKKGERAAAKREYNLLRQIDEGLASELQKKLEEDSGTGK